MPVKTKGETDNPVSPESGFSGKGNTAPPHYLPEYMFS